MEKPFEHDGRVVRWKGKGRIKEGGALCGGLRSSSIAQNLYERLEATEGKFRLW